MKRIIALVLCAVLCVLCLSGCVSVNFSPLLGGGVTGKGDPESYDFHVGSFSEIKVSLLCNIQYYAASSDTVTLEIQPNLKEYITVEVSGGVLTVRATRNINWSNNQTPVLTVSTPILNRLTLEGAGTFTAHDTITADSFALRLDGAGNGKFDLDVENLSVAMSGAGDYEVTGQADTAEFNMSGAGQLNALSLQTRKARVDLSGVGAVRINCSESLQIIADGLGTVEYKGSPSVDISRGGLVSVKKLD